MDSTTYITYAAAHEAGHTYGMRHSGRADNLSPDGVQTFPLMGCGPLPSPYPSTPQADDVAQAFTRNGPRATPNWGFENGLGWWTRSSTTVVTSNDEYEGSFSVLIPPGEWIRTRVRIAEPGLHRMVARYKGAAANSSGSVRFRTSMVGVDYDTWPISSDGCPGLNNYSEGSVIQDPVDTTRNVTTSWSLFSVNLATISGGGEGIRGSIWVYNNTNVNIFVDNVALEER